MLAFCTGSLLPPSGAASMAWAHGGDVASPQAWSLNGLGEAALLTGDTAEALTHLSEAFTIATDTNSRHQLARANVGLGHIHRVGGEPGQARLHYEQAYAIYTELDMPDAEDVLGYLGLLSASGTPRPAARLQGRRTNTPHPR